MGEWTAVAMPRVSRDDIAAILSKRNVGWGLAAHVTATTTLTQAIRDEAAVALPVATMRDLVVMPGLPGGMRLTIETFRNPARSPRADRPRYERLVKRWQQEATGRRLRIGVQVDDSLRAFVRAEANDGLGRALLASRRSYASSIHALIAAGIRPQDLRPRDAMAQLAARAWARAEQDVEALGAPRELTWVEPAELTAGRSSRAQELKARLRDALEAAFGPAVDGRWSIVHHGFYFYTAPQWQMFQALRSLDEVDQLFVVHDDGHNPAFASWRYYFRPEWGMPVPMATPAADDQVTLAAEWLRRALTGAESGSLEGVRLMEYRSPVDLVRHWTQETDGLSEGQEPPVRYAAAAEDVDRFVQRLGRVQGTAPPQLAQLPVGNFLLTLHACIQRGTDGHPEVVLSPEALLDLVASGFVGHQSGAVGVRPALLRRVLSFFAGCRNGKEWKVRAAALRAAVENRAARLGSRTADDSDADRIDRAASNPVRLAPWVDVTEEEVTAVEAAVNRVVDLIDEVVRRERVVLGDHLDRIRHTLDGVLRTLQPEEREVVEAKIRGFGVLTDEELDVDGLVDVVAMLVGRTADFDPAPVNDDDPASTRVRQLRGLDGLGLSRTNDDLHLANLSEHSFPTSGMAVGWPFTLDDVRTAVDAGAEPVTVELMATRAATGPLGDLYLLWLALDGTGREAALTLSWISRSAGEKRRLSPLVALLARLHHPDKAVREAAGGLEARTVDADGGNEPLGERQPPARGDGMSDDDVMAAVEDAVHPVAAASANACPRRFALQWVLGTSAGFMPEHLTTMLYGNLTNALVREGLENDFGARATTGAVWAHLTEGQRASSLDKAVVKRTSREVGARPAWIWTLGGTGSGSRPLDAAYQAAQAMLAPDADLLAPEGAEFLPMGVTGDGAPKVCSRCPVQTRCLHWQDADR